MSQEMDSEAMSDHAAVKKGHLKWAERFFKSVSADTLIEGQVESLLAQWHADAIRNERVKEAEWCLALIRSHEDEYLSTLQQRIAQLKRGEA